MLPMSNPKIFSFFVSSFNHENNEYKLSSKNDIGEPNVRCLSDMMMVQSNIRSQ